MGTAITIAGGSGSDTINFAFTVTGTNTTHYASIFADFVNNRLADGDPLTKLSPLGSANAIPGGDTTQPGIYDLLPSSVQGGSNSYIISNPGYIIDSIGGNATVSSFGHDTILVAAINAATTFNEGGADDKVIFVTGNNTFNGDTGAGGGAGDTLVGGSGFDTFYTGSGATTVNSGTGDGTFYLQDTLVGSTVNDHVWLDDGHAIVYANGANDAVVATTAGQTIDGGTSSTSYLTVVLQPNSDGTANGNDLVNAGAGATLVYAANSNDTVNGGSGGLFFVAGPGVTDTVNGGGGETAVFGASGDSITFGNTAGVSTGLTELIAGSGSETLDGSSAQSGIAFYGTADSTGSNLLIGGAGNDTLQAGVGNETLTGGAGNNLFVFNGAVDAGGTITISDFAGSSGNEIGFTNYDPSQIANAINNGQDENGNFVVTLSDNTQITFVGVTTASELNGHIINF
jgi:hypothetical protein